MAELLLASAAPALASAAPALAHAAHHALPVLGHAVVDHGADLAVKAVMNSQVRNAALDGGRRLAKLAKKRKKEEKRRKKKERRRRRRKEKEEEEKRRREANGEGEEEEEEEKVGRGETTSPVAVAIAPKTYAARVRSSATARPVRQIWEAEPWQHWEYGMVTAGGMRGMGRGRVADVRLPKQPWEVPQDMWLREPMWNAERREAMRTIRNDVDSRRSAMWEEQQDRLLRMRAAREARSNMWNLDREKEARRAVMRAKRGEGYPVAGAGVPAKGAWNVEHEAWDEKGRAAGYGKGRRKKLAGGDMEGEQDYRQPSPPPIEDTWAPDEDHVPQKGEAGRATLILEAEKAEKAREEELRKAREADARRRAVVSSAGGRSRMGTTTPTSSDQSRHLGVEDEVRSWIAGVGEEFMDENKSDLGQAALDMITKGAKFARKIL